MSLGRAELYFGDDFLGRNYRYWAGDSGRWVVRAAKKSARAISTVALNKTKSDFIARRLMDSVYFATTLTH